VALGSGRSCANTTAVPDVTMIETALAGGTVVREMVCAGLSEHRTRAACSALEFTKGCVGVQPGPRISLPRGRAGIPDEKNDCERTRKQGTAIPTEVADSADTNDAGNNEPQITRIGRGWWALPRRPPEIYRLRANPGEQKQKRDVPRVSFRRPVSGLGSWRGARVASPRSPVLRPGHWPCYPRAARGTTVRARGVRDMPPQIMRAAAQPRNRRRDRIRSLRGRVLSQTDCSACVIRDPRRSFFQTTPVFGDGTSKTRNLAKSASPDAEVCLRR
jgi:hypothetical protein